MKTDWTHLEDARQLHAFYGSRTGERFGTFTIARGKTRLLIIASLTSEWEHVSVHAEDYKGQRTPTWAEMDFVKDLFFEPEECVMQLHVPKSEHVNLHSTTLHLWKPLEKEIPRPPRIMV